ncbi:hypothetical protein [Cohnella panacarvi]|uniref:hypothetical protein n=1 Tax=Cohnella panacarvi TaxID=400776 RepID=UPI00047E83FA|nr:hypothetical protein [Cohnella panacarvi]
MKIGTFVMGGLAGVAIVMLIQRNQMMSAVCASMGQSMKNKMGGMKDEMIGKALGSKFVNNIMTRSSASSSNRKEQHSGSDHADLSQVSQLASQDPQVANQINAILEQSGQNRI